MNKKIIELTKHKQCDAYYKALKRKDTIAAYMLYIPPSLTSLHIIQSR